MSRDRKEFVRKRKATAMAGDNLDPITTEKKNYRTGRKSLEREGA